MEIIIKKFTANKKWKSADGTFKKTVEPTTGSSVVLRLDVGEFLPLVCFSNPHLARKIMLLDGEMIVVILEKQRGKDKDDGSRSYNYNLVDALTMKDYMKLVKLEAGNSDW